MRRYLRILLPILVVALVIVVVLSRCNSNTPIIGSSDANTQTSSSQGSSSTNDTQNSTAAELITIEYNPTATGIYIARDGSIKSAEITDFSNEGFDKPRYDLETLRSYVTEWVDSYNQAKEKKSVSIESIELKDNAATLILNYDSINSFIDFQGADFGVTSLKIGSSEFAARNFALSGL